MWAKRDMVRERHRWEEDIGLEEKVAMPPSPDSNLHKEESQTPIIPEAPTEETGSQIPNATTVVNQPQSDVADTRVESELRKDDSPTPKGEGL